jgi:hypothetical protein
MLLTHGHHSGVLGDELGTDLGMLAEHARNSGLRKTAKHTVGQCLRTMVHGVAKVALKAEEVSWQREAHRLHLAGVQRFVELDTPVIEGVDVVVIIVLTIEMLTGIQQ